jgi:hypothetical protein
MQPGQEGEFLLRVYASDFTPIKLQQLPNLLSNYDSLAYEGSWENNKSAGGSKNTYEWVKNTQYRFKVVSNDPETKKITVEFLLRQHPPESQKHLPKKEQDLHYISCYVLQGEDSGARSFIMDKNKIIIASNKFTKIREATFTVEAEVGKTLNIIPSTFHANQEGDYTLCATWQKDPNVQVYLQPILEFDSHIIKGKWTKELSGGVNDQAHNPKYKLMVNTKDTVVDVVLAQQQTHSENSKNGLAAIGFHIFKGNDLVARTNSWIYGKTVHLRLKLQVGTYMISPSTFHSSVCIHHTVMVYHHKNFECHLSE